MEQRENFRAADHTGPFQVGNALLKERVGAAGKALSEMQNGRYMSMQGNER